MADVVQEMRNDLSRRLRAAAGALLAELGRDPTVPGFVVEVPREKAHGDFATNLALLLARHAGQPPRRLAEEIVARLDRGSLPLVDVVVAGPGFINFRLEPSWLYRALSLAVSLDRDYGRSSRGRGARVQVEFVSANPTGLLHMGNARGAALGDSIAALLEFVGYRVTREFYINDFGHQIELFGRSLEARYFQHLGLEAEVPPDGYHGEDVVATVRLFAARHGDRYLRADQEERRQALVEFALAEKLAGMKAALEQFGVHYDVWFSERELHERGAVREVLAELERRGYLYHREGALWFRATAFGADKDDVVVRASGVPTYFAADIAYHKNKFDRGFDRVIDVWGADHHGHVGRVRAAMAALGYDPERLRVVIMQLVRLVRGGEVVRMSKRTGQVVTLEELMEEVGRDAARYFFVMRSADSHLEFDLDLARAQSNENPVYYVQYAHARIASVLRQAAERGITLPQPEEADLSLLHSEPELDLVRRVAAFPEEVAVAAEELAPHRLAHYLHELAGTFHSFYNGHRILSEDHALTAARLVLVRAVGVVLRNGLNLLGVAAPERM